MEVKYEEVISKFSMEEINLAITNCIKESKKYGFDLIATGVSNKAKVTTRCNLCNEIFTQELFLTYYIIKDKLYIGYSFPLVCNNCIKEEE